MTAYGIFVVQPGWHEGDAVTMEAPTYQHFKDAFQRGTMALFYMKEPVDALVGEAEVMGEVVHTEAEPEAPILDPAIPASLRVQEPMRRMEAGSEPLADGNRLDQHIYRLPYRMVRSQKNTPPIHLGTIKARMGSGFNVFDDEWIPLSEEEYNALVSVWEGSRS